MLKERHSKLDKIISVHYSKLTNIPPQNYEKHPFELKKCSAKTQTSNLIIWARCQPVTTFDYVAVKTPVISTRKT